MARTQLDQTPTYQSPPTAALDGRRGGFIDPRRTYDEEIDEELHHLEDGFLSGEEEEEPWDQRKAEISSSSGRLRAADGRDVRELWSASSGDLGISRQEPSNVAMRHQLEEELDDGELPSLTPKRRAAVQVTAPLHSSVPAAQHPVSYQPVSYQPVSHHPASHHSASMMMGKAPNSRPLSPPSVTGAQHAEPTSHGRFWGQLDAREMEDDYGPDAEKLHRFSRSEREDETDDLIDDISMDTGEDPPAADFCGQTLTALNEMCGALATAPSDEHVAPPKVIERRITATQFLPQPQVDNDDEEYTAIEVEFVEPKNPPIPPDPKASAEKKKAYLAAMARKAKADYERDRRQSATKSQEGVPHVDSIDEDVYATFSAQEKRKFLKLINSGTLPAEASKLILGEKSVREKQLREKEEKLAAAKREKEEKAAALKREKEAKREASKAKPMTARLAFWKKKRNDDKNNSSMEAASDDGTPTPASPPDDFSAASTPDRSHLGMSKSNGSRSIGTKPLPTQPSPVSTPQRSYPPPVTPSDSPTSQGLDKSGASNEGKDRKDSSGFAKSGISYYDAVRRDGGVDDAEMDLSQILASMSTTSPQDKSARRPHPSQNRPRGFAALDDGRSKSAPHFRSEEFNRNRPLSPRQRRVQAKKIADMERAKSTPREHEETPREPSGTLVDLDDEYVPGPPPKLMPSIRDQERRDRRPRAVDIDLTYREKDKKEKAANDGRVDAPLSVEDLREILPYSASLVSDLDNTTVKEGTVFTSATSINEGASQPENGNSEVELPEEVNRRIEPPSKEVKRWIEMPPEEVNKGIEPPPNEVNRGIAIPPEEVKRRVALPLEDENRGIALPLEDENRGIAMPLEDESRGIAMPLEDENRGIAMPLEDENRGIAMPLEDENRGIAMPLEDENRGIALPLEDENRGIAMPLEDENGGAEFPEKVNGGAEPPQKVNGRNSPDQRSSMTPVVSEQPQISPKVETSEAVPEAESTVEQVDDDLEVDMDTYLNSTDIYSVLQSANLDAQSVFTTGTTMTSASAYTQSSRRRRPGAAKSRLAKSKTAVPNRRQGWHETIKAAAVHAKREWQPGSGWKDYEDPHTEGIASSKPVEKMHLDLGKAIHTPKEKPRDLGVPTRSPQHVAVPFPRDWEKERKKMLAHHPPGGNNMPSLHSEQVVLKASRVEQVEQVILRTPQVEQVMLRTESVEDTIDLGMADPIGAMPSSSVEAILATSSPMREKIKQTKRKNPSSPRRQITYEKERKASGWVESMKAASRVLAREGQEWNPDTGWKDPPVIVGDSPSDLVDFSHANEKIVIKLPSPRRKPVQENGRGKVRVPEPLVVPTLSMEEEEMVEVVNVDPEPEILHVVDHHELPELESIDGNAATPLFRQETPNFDEMSTEPESVSLPPPPPPLNIPRLPPPKPPIRRDVEGKLNQWVEKSGNSPKRHGDSSAADGSDRAVASVEKYVQLGETGSVRSFPRDSDPSRSPVRTIGNIELSESREDSVGGLKHGTTQNDSSLLFPLLDDTEDSDKRHLLESSDSFPSMTSRPEMLVNIVKEKIDEEDLELFTQSSKDTRGSHSRRSRRDQTETRNTPTSRASSTTANAKVLDRMSPTTTKGRRSPSSRSVRSSFSKGDGHSEAGSSRRGNGPVDVDEVDNAWDSDDDEDEKGTNNGWETRSGAASSTSMSRGARVVPKLKASKRDTSPVSVRRENMSSPLDIQATLDDLAAREAELSMSESVPKPSPIPKPTPEPIRPEPEIDDAASSTSQPLQVKWAPPQYDDDVRVKKDPAQNIWRGTGAGPEEVRGEDRRASTVQKLLDEDGDPKVALVQERLRQWESLSQEEDPPPREHRASTAEWKSFLGKKVHAENAVQQNARVDLNEMGIEEDDSLFEFDERNPRSSPIQPLGVSPIVKEARVDMRRLNRHYRDEDEQTSYTDDQDEEDIIGKFLEGSEAYGPKPGENRSIFQRISECAAPVMIAASGKGEPPAAHLAFLRAHPTSAPGGSSKFIPPALCGRPEVINEDEDDENDSGHDSSKRSPTGSYETRSYCEPKNLPIGTSNLCEPKSGSVVSEDFGAKTAYLEAIAMKTAVSKPRSSSRRRGRNGGEGSVVSAASSSQHSEKWKALLERKRASPTSRSHVSDVSKAAERYAQAKLEEMMAQRGERPASAPRSGREILDRVLPGRDRALSPPRSDSHAPSVSMRAAAEDLAAARVEAMLATFSPGEGNSGEI